MAELKIQRHPLIIDHDTQTVVEMDLRPGESLYTFLSRHIVNLDGMQVTVHIGGKPAPRHLWHCIYPKHGNDILVRNVLERTALLIVALIVLSIFTLGAAAAVAGAAGAAGGVIGAAGFAVGSALGTGVLASIAVGAMQVIGAMIINKVLGPKPPSASSIDRDSVYSLSAVRNSARQYEPMGLLIGEIQVTPDVITIPYSVYQGNDQYMSLVLSAGVNVAEYEDLYIGDTLLSNFEEIQVWQSGFSNMPNQVIPISGNVDTETGPELEANVEVIRTTSVDTVRIQVDISFLLFDLTTKGKKRNNQETIQIRYRDASGGTWQSFGNYNIVSSDQTQQRRSYIKDVPSGQYEVSVKRLGLDTGTVQPNNSAGATAEFTWTTLVSYQEDNANYRGISRIGMTMRATGQFSGTPDQIRGLMRARPIPLWNGTQWVTATNRANGLSNVAANVLKYLRGYYDEDNVLIAGMGWTDDQIDIEAFKEWMVDCTLYNWNYDAWITSDRNHDEMLSSLALCGLGKIDFAPGKATPVWSAPGQAETAIVNMGTITKASFQVDYTLARSADGIEYSYYDREKNDTVTLRVTAPGVEVMLNPARITGEGVTTEAHAAYMARYHMAQMLYQLKDVAYTTHIEFMTYGLLDVIQLQHDLTQWAYGGRLRDFYVNESNRPVITFDDAVPYPASGKAYVGLRVPGELVCRIFEVAPFSGVRRTVTLMEAWPLDATQPGSDIDENPVHDTLWMYDFKETPGYRCRVISISPADDLKTGAIAVVPEGPEFWVYVETGNYVPPPNQSLLNVAPIATNLVMKEVRVTQGNTVFSQINITWSVAGFADNCIVTCAGEDGIPQEVAVTSGRSASWRVEGPGEYLVVVRPYREGVPGKATSGQVVVYGENQPPVNPDVFAIDDQDGGVRKYAWGWYAQTVQSSDFAGVEIRFTEGSVPSPNWDAMTPLGDNNDGFHPATFESVLPPAGEYTFSLRARNTAGVLASQQLVIIRTLSSNLGQVIGSIKQDISKEIVDRFAADYAEAQARIAAVNQLTDALQEEVQNRVDAVTAEASARQDAIQAQADALLNEQIEREAAITAEAATRQSADDSLAYSISQISAGSGTQFDSKVIWYFDISAEGWNGNVSGGYLNPASAIAVSPAGLGIIGSEYRYVKVRVKKIGSPVWQGTVGWKAAAGAWQATTVPEPTWSAAGVATFDLDDIGWDALTVDQIRMQLGTSVDASNYYLFDWVAVGRPTPGASVALVQEETQARIAGDAAEAIQRTTLAAQLRGNYTGSDVAGVTQGLIFSERQARVSADGALAEQVTSLSAEVDDKASAEALETLTTRVDVTEDGLVAVTEATQLLTAQLDGEYAGDTDNNAGDTDVYAGSITVYTVIADGDAALARQINEVQADFGEFTTTITQQVEAVSSELETQGTALTSVVAALPGKASAESVTLLTGRVTQTETGLTAASNSISQLTATVGGKADASVVQALSATVTQNGQDITTLANSINSVSATVAGKADASVVQSLTATVTQQGGVITGITAQYFLAVDANGRIGGMKIGNNGTVVNFQILADNFVIVSPSGGARTEYSGGNWRTYDANGTLRARFGSGW